MAYNNAIPQSTDELKNSQSDLLANFQAIKTLVDVNHVTFDDPTGDQGKHKYLTMPEQSSNPTTAVSEMALFTQLASITSKNEMALRKESNGSVLPFTASTLSNTPAPAALSSGFSYLPSGFILQWGSSTGLAGGVNTITFAAPAFPTKCISVILNPLKSGTSDEDFAVRLIDFPASNQFRFYISKRTATGAAATTGGVSYLAIGY